MSITNGYVTLTKLQRRLNTSGPANSDLMEEAIQSASREIDKFCARRFYTDAAASARVYDVNAHAITGIRSDCLAVVHDFYTTTGLVIKTDTGSDGTYATTWASTDYELRPLNGVVDGESGWPYWEIRAIGANRFPCYGHSRPAPLQVTAKWGWAAVPDPVYQACLIIAKENYKLMDVSFTTAGIGDLGTLSVTQVPVAQKKLQPYRRAEAAVMVA